MASEQQRTRTERLRWASRRALLENDLLLQRFWQRQPAELDETLAASLERLLAMDDHDLWALLSGRCASTDPELGKLVELLRQPAIRSEDL
ncbi:MAG: succinate dehydrogenase assembly factor 2 [Pseudomonadota bacterium]|uniref:FAD assembly factor SdhE n=1 Tax=Sulfuricystis thermophila TaxID=2496847 RepID=UPI001036CB0F|nr:succinate dehydrogenase assembly factor 2 [Sulfuricystis thermophila]MDI6749404.1 succinate dehydrogenase assembly factor 2 [Rhodocyclaceae bacterium]